MDTQKAILEYFGIIIIIMSCIRLIYEMIDFGTDTKKGYDNTISLIIMIIGVALVYFI